jgi:formate hydrogenlyase subunit 3/multisubunit Na+/H+ antiporter MnhD subunit
VNTSLNTLLWLSPLLVPLVAVVVVTARPGPRTSWLLVAAPVPAAVFAVTGGPGGPPELGWLLLGAQVSLDDVGRALLGLTAVVWVVAAIYARRDAEQRDGYAAWWLLSLTGNVGVILADDVLSFYSAFVLLTLAAYGLVVHRREASVRRAGRVYLVLGVAGETALLAGLLLAAVDAPGLRLVEVADAMAGSSRRDLVVALLAGGFGIKAGVIGLHVWLPLAHPAAPVAASAVLSGAMIKAGLVGWLRLLPIGEIALPGWATTFIVLGLTTAVSGVALGLTQHAPKVVLAYSSVSQMGFVTLLVGVALAAPATAPVAIAAAAVYAFHHGLAKAALFLAVGVLPTAARGWHRGAVLTGMGVAGLALAGAPLSSGAFAKAWMKQSLDLALIGPAITTKASVAAAGTTVLMVRFIVLLRDQPSNSTGEAWPLGPWFALVGGVVVLTPISATRLFPDVAVPGSTSLVTDAAWPVLLGLIIAGTAIVAARYVALPLPSLPPGDVVVLGERAVASTGRVLVAGATPVAVLLGRSLDAARDAMLGLGRHDEVLDRIEDRMTRWWTGGAMVALVAIAITATLLATVP